MRAGRGREGIRTIAETEEYCRLVAGSVGRLSLGVFGTSGDPDQAAKLADVLGIALQLTNILRDIVEDRGMGRVYLPTADIERFGCAPTSPARPRPWASWWRSKPSEPNGISPRD